MLQDLDGLSLALDIRCPVCNRKMKYNKVTRSFSCPIAEHNTISPAMEALRGLARDRGIWTAKARIKIQRRRSFRR